MTPLRALFALAGAGFALAGAAGLTLFSCQHGPPSARVNPAPSAPAHRQPGGFEVGEVIYDKKLGDGWQDWGWGKHDLTNGQPARVSFGDYAGIILHHEEFSTAYGGISFQFLAPKDFGVFLDVSLMYRQLDEHALPPVVVENQYVADLPGGWKEVLIPWNVLNPQGSPFDRIQIRARTQVGSDMVSLDHVVLTKGSGAALSATAATGPARLAHLAIRCDRPGPKINPLIYGIAKDNWDLGAPIRRMGGNPMSRYNWEGGFWNLGNDWFFENGAPKQVNELLAPNAAHGMKSAIVVPTIGWVSKDATSFGFPISKLGAQRNHDPNKPEAGDGFHADGSSVPPGSPTETSIPAPPELIRKWIEHVRQADKATGKRSIDMYILDNEPALWNTTHRDVHPDPTTYDELLDRTIQYAGAIRSADPEAVIAGPAEWGWPAYFYSAKDLAKGVVPHGDNLMHAGTPLVAWYLRKLADYQKKTGTKLLDVFDLHFYPQGQNVYGNGEGGVDSETAALRIRSTRALWDDSYEDESWIKDKVHLIPRMKQWVADNYPGLGISLGEWSFGGEKHISGALATAEALGRFGQLGLTSAFYWYGPDPGTPSFFGFRAYRNYDGKGSRFLDQSVPTEMATNVSIFASTDASGKVTAIVLNLDPGTAAQADIDVTHCGKLKKARTFSYSANLPGIFLEPPAPPSGGISETLPPYSLKIVELVPDHP